MAATIVEVVEVDDVVDDVLVVVDSSEAGDDNGLETSGLDN